MKPKAKGKPEGGLEATGEEILNAVKGYRELIKTGFPVELSMELQKALQALRLAAAPIEDERERIAFKYAKRKGREVVAGDVPGTIVIDERRRDTFLKESKTLLSLRHVVRATPISRRSIPWKLGGRDVVIAGEVFDLLGPFLVD